MQGVAFLFAVGVVYWMTRAFTIPDQGSDVLFFPMNTMAWSMVVPIFNRFYEIDVTNEYYLYITLTIAYDLYCKMEGKRPFTSAMRAAVTDTIRSAIFGVYVALVVLEKQYPLNYKKF